VSGRKWVALQVTRRRDVRAGKRFTLLAARDGEWKNRLKRASVNVRYFPEWLQNYFDPRSGEQLFQIE